MIVVYFLRGLGNILIYLVSAGIGIGASIGLVVSIWRLVRGPKDDPEARRPHTMMRPRESVAIPFPRQRRVSSR